MHAQPFHQLALAGDAAQIAALRGRKVRLLRVYVRAMLLAEDGTGPFGDEAVEETGATHLQGDQPGNRTE